MNKVIIVGGGAAGMMAAISAAKEGKKVCILEKNEKLGKKLFITGKGRCNITNACPADEFIKHVVTNQRFLRDITNDAPYVLRGKNREKAVSQGKPVTYNRLAMMMVSVFHLSHWRLDVTSVNYLV